MSSSNNESKHLRSQTHEIVKQLLEQGQGLQLAVTRSLAQDEALLSSETPISFTDSHCLNADPCQADSLLDYLLGKSMPLKEEIKVLETLKCLPMIDDILGVLDFKQPVDKIQSQNMPQRDDCLSPRSQMLSAVTSLRLKVFSLELSEAGLRHLAPARDSQRAPPSFLLEYLPPRSCPGQHSNPVRLCSRKVTGRGVTFGQEKIHSCESSKPLTFKVYCRYASQRVPNLLGSAQLDWTDILQSQTYEFSLPVRHATKPEVVGRLKLRAEVGQGNTIASRKTLHYGSRNIASENLSVPPTARTIQSTNLLRNHESVRDDATEKALLLRALVAVSQTKGFSESLNIYIVMKAFWIEDDIKSQIAWQSRNPSLILHESFPVLLSPFFLERCRGNHAVLEVWDAHPSGDRMIGLAKLPLQTLFLAYNDSTVALKLMAAKLPVVCADNWVPVVHPVSGVQAGMLLTLLALGSDEQVALLEQRRGLRAVDAAAVNLSATAHAIPTMHLESFSKIHKMEIAIEKISGFPLFQNMKNGEADCFIDLKMPVRTASGEACKTYVSDMTLCTLEPRFCSHHTHILTLPPSVSLASFLESSERGGVMFRVWCRFYQPSLRDVIVAQAMLSPSDIAKVEQEFNRKQETISAVLAIPLTFISSPETSKICDKYFGTGHITIRITYSAYSEAETFPKQLHTETATKIPEKDSRIKYSEVDSLSKQLQVEVLPTSDSMLRHLASPSSTQTTRSQTSQTDLSPVKKPQMSVTSTQTALQLADFDHSDSMKSDITPEKLPQEVLSNSSESPEKLLQQSHFQVLESSLSRNISTQSQNISSSLISSRNIATTNVPSTHNILSQIPSSQNDSLHTGSSQNTTSHITSSQNTPPHMTSPQNKTTHVPSTQNNQPQMTLSENNSLCTVSSQNTSSHLATYHDRSPRKAENHDLSVEIVQEVSRVSSHATTSQSSTRKEKSRHKESAPAQPSDISFARRHPAPMFRAHVEVERAVGLPKLYDTLLGILVQPSTYVTLRGEQPGTLLTSDIVQHSCEPVWDWHCDTCLPAHHLLQEKQHLILKVWMPTNCETRPDPVEDMVLCFAAVDLSVLLNNLPQVSGWFNLLNFAGQCQGYIKVCVTPLESLASYKQLKDSLELMCPAEPPSPAETQHEVKLFEPPPINPYADANISFLERKLKETMGDLDDLTSQLREKVAAMDIKCPTEKTAVVQKVTNLAVTSMCCDNSTPLGFISVPLCDAATSMHCVSSTDRNETDISMFPGMSAGNNEAATSMHCVTSADRNETVTSIIPGMSAGNKKAGTSAGNDKADASIQTVSCVGNNEAVLSTHLVPGNNELTYSSDSTDSDVSKFLSNFDLEMLHRLVEHLDDEMEKSGRCSKPDFVCHNIKQAPPPLQTQLESSSSDTEETSLKSDDESVAAVPRQAPEGGNPVEKAPSTTSPMSPVLNRKRSNPE